MAADRADSRNLSTCPDLIVLSTSSENAADEANEKTSGGTKMRATTYFLQELMTSHTSTRIVTFPGGKINACLGSLVVESCTIPPLNSNPNR